MPRSNRYILPGRIYHLTHRCHDRKFLLRCRLDRIVYCTRLRLAAHKHDVSLFDFSVTCNHVHMIAVCKHLSHLSLFMQQLEGEFADYYNHRKNRTGAFWGERFHCTMIEGGEHLWNCLRYIDLNMVRAGVVRHPSEWPWCGYHELVGDRQRYRLLDIDRLVEILDLADRKSLIEIHQRRILECIQQDRLAREEIWTESIAVGSEAYLKEVVSKIGKKRKRLYMSSTKDGDWFVREGQSIYA